MQKSKYKGKRRLYVSIPLIDYDKKPETIVNFTTNDVEQYLFVDLCGNKYDVDDYVFFDWNILNTDNSLYWQPSGGYWEYSHAFSFQGITKVKPNTNFELYISGAGEVEGGEYGGKIFNLFEDELVFNEDKTKITDININHDYDSDDYSCKDNLFQLGAVSIDSVIYDDTWN